MAEYAPEQTDYDAKEKGGLQRLNCYPKTVPQAVRAGSQFRQLNGVGRHFCGELGPCLLKIRIPQKWPD